MDSLYRFKDLIAERAFKAIKAYKYGYLYALAIICFVALYAIESSVVWAPADTRVSRFDTYRGYSRVNFCNYSRFSGYIQVRDGTKLAVDIFRPTKNGKVSTARLPVIWKFEFYNRAHTNKAGELITVIDDQPWLKEFLSTGYVIAVVDVRGTGASFGEWSGPFMPIEARDAYDVTEWFAAQPWCNGRIGMFGSSYCGTNQYLAASTAPPHLKAIFPEMAMFDLYQFCRSGGVFRDDFARGWRNLIADLPNYRSIYPVDGSDGVILLNMAISEHKGNADVCNMFAELPFYNSYDGKLGIMPYLVMGPSNYVQKINRSGVAVYQVAGWYDIWTRDAFLWFNNLKTPKKLIVGPWHHTQLSEDDGEQEVDAERHRWFDYWLKGIKNGVMDTPPIHYYVTGLRTEEKWRCASKWPLAESVPTRYFFNVSASTSKDASAMGFLGLSVPKYATRQSDYKIDYLTTSGKSTRWTNGRGGRFGYADMSSNDARSLCYTTRPLTSHTEVTGHCIVNLWFKSNSADVCVFAYLEDVDESGFSRYVTEGALAASHRATATPSFNYIGLPYHRGKKEDVLRLPSNPVEMVFDLMPISYVFAKGHRIRIAINGADRDNAFTEILSPAPTMTVYCNSTRTSYITLPITRANN